MDCFKDLRDCEQYADTNNAHAIALKFSLRKMCPYSSYSAPSFPVLGLNTKRYSVSLRIHSSCGKTRTRITPNTDTFYAVMYTSRLFITSGTLLPIIKHFGHKIGLQFINSALEKKITQPKS